MPGEIHHSSKEMNAAQESEGRLLVSRFTSTLAGAFRAFIIYRHDNKAIDEILNNLLKRFQAASPDNGPIRLGVTNLSLTFKGETAGFQEVTVYLASTLRMLGIKEMLIKGPLQSRHFFAFLNIISNKESTDAKIEKLANYIGESDDRLIALIPIASSAAALRMPDEIIRKRLAELLVPRAQNGPGFLEALMAASITSLPDFYTWICRRADLLSPATRGFVRELADATREGFFPIERFLNVFPMPGPLKERLAGLISPPATKARRLTALNHSFRPRERGGAERRANWPSYLCSYSNEEVEHRKRMRTIGTHQASAQDLDLAEILMREAGDNFLMGLRLLLRVLAAKNPVSVQEKALRIGIAVWTRSQTTTDDAGMASLLSSLRQCLSAPHNISLTLYPLRTATMESEMFNRLAAFVISLGENALPSLITALEAEEDRATRKKLCHLITLIAQQQGEQFLVDSLSKGSHFLLRNLIMILGDIRSKTAVDGIGSCIRNTNRIVRIEAVRSLIKIGNPDSADALLHNFASIQEIDMKTATVNFFVQKREKKAVDPLIRMAKEPSTPLDLKRTILNAVATIGGYQAKSFLESLTQGGSVFSRFNSEEKETQRLAASLLKKMSP